MRYHASKTKSKGSRYNDDGLSSDDSTPGSGIIISLILADPGDSIAEIKKQLEFVSKKLSDYDSHSKKKRSRGSRSNSLNAPGQASSKKSKISSGQDKEFSLEKKRYLSEAINNLPQESVIDVFQIIKEKVPDLNVKK